MTKELDLRDSIRPGLDILANEIVIALKKRTRFMTNDAVYKPGLVLNSGATSLLDYELNRMEVNHAELGRYTYADQESFTEVSDVAPVINRLPHKSPIRRMRANVGERLITFYKHWVAKACEHGDDAHTYGETVTADVSALFAMMERVTLGKYVAESKFANAKRDYLATGGDRDALIALLVNRDRENQVIELATRLGNHYELQPALAQDVFQFMIDVTIDIEIDYLRMRIAAPDD